MREPLLVGVDLGTTRVRAAAFDANGRQLAARGHANPLDEIGPGRVEQRVEHVAVAADAALKALTLELDGRAADVAVVGLTGQMGGITAVDQAGQPVMPYDSPLDGRCRPYFERFFAPRLRTILAEAGIAPQWGQKVLYWRGEHPAVWPQIARFATLAGVYGADLVGLPGSQAFADRSYAALSGLWSGGSDWDPQLCDLAGLTPQKLPRLVPPGTIIGNLRAERAVALGLPFGVPVVAGTGDCVASLLGAGAVTPGGLFDLSGTASVLVACSDHMIVDFERQIVNCLPSAIDGMWYLLHALFGGQAVRWFAEQFPPGQRAGTDLASRLAEWDLRALALEGIASPDLFFLPQLGGRWNPPRPGARGGWLGLTWGTQPEELYVAILESIAFEFALALERMQQLVPALVLSEVRVLGGGARSRLWNQIKADILGLPHRPLREVEFGARGAALIAGEAVGIVRDVQATAAMVEYEPHVVARTCRRPQRQAQLRRYRVLTEEVEQILSRLATDPIANPDYAQTGP